MEDKQPIKNFAKSKAGRHACKLWAHFGRKSHNLSEEIRTIIMIFKHSILSEDMECTGTAVSVGPKWTEVQTRGSFNTWIFLHAYQAQAICWHHTKVECSFSSISTRKQKLRNY